MRPGGNSYGVTFNTIAQQHLPRQWTRPAGRGVQELESSRRFQGTYSYGHVVVGNALYNNGGPGVAMHNHVPPPPGIDLSDNAVVGNTIYGNATDIGVGNPSNTGISIYSVAPVNGTVISQNTIGHEQVGIYYNVPSGVLRATTE